MGGDFFTTAAQAIPLIYVAIAFEGRAAWKPELWEGWTISPRTMSRIRLMFMSVTTWFLVVGETASLWALGRDLQFSFEAGTPGWFAGLSLGIGGVALIAQVSAHLLLEAFRPSNVLPMKASIQLGSIVLGLTAATAAAPIWFILYGFSN